jgi:hypothetical protein
LIICDALFLVAIYMLASTCVCFYPLPFRHQQTSSTMMLDVVATRDIQPDEEVFIDYGQDWEDAWDKHVKEWKSPCTYFSGSCYESSKQVHTMNDNKFDRRYHEWSDTHFSTCKLTQALSPKDPGMYYITKTVPNSFEKKSRRVKQSYKGIDFEHEGFDIPVYTERVERDGTTITESHHPCKILESWEAEGRFDVLYLFNTEKMPGATYSRTLLKSMKVPAELVKFRVRPFKSDMYSPHAFRHDIAIPDEKFPPLWKDLAGVR